MGWLSLVFVLGLMGTFTEGVMMDIPDVGLHCFEDTLPPDRNTSLVISLSSAVFCRIQVFSDGAVIGEKYAAKHLQDWTMIVETNATTLKIRVCSQATERRPHIKSLPSLTYEAFSFRKGIPAAGEESTALAKEKIREVTEKVELMLEGLDDLLADERDQISLSMSIKWRVIRWTLLTCLVVMITGVRQLVVAQKYLRMKRV